MEWYFRVLKNYDDFGSRAQRKEYWMPFLCNLIIGFAIAIVDRILGLGGALGWIFTLAFLLPGTAVAVRRLHDTGRSGWWMLVGLIPVIGTLVLVPFLLLDSQPGSNEYGPNPKGAAAIAR